jgi:hypothetical protein
MERPAKLNALFGAHIVNGDDTLGRFNKTDALPKFAPQRW